VQLPYEVERYVGARQDLAELAELVADWQVLAEHDGQLVVPVNLVTKSVRREGASTAYWQIGRNRIVMSSH
jgi:hypothetical protein